MYKKIFILLFFYNGCEPVDQFKSIFVDGRVGYLLVVQRGYDQPCAPTVGIANRPLEVVSKDHLDDFATKGARSLTGLHYLFVDMFGSKFYTHYCQQGDCSFDQDHSQERCFLDQRFESFVKEHKQR